MTLGMITDSQWYEVLQQHQIKVDEWSLVLRLYEGFLNPDK